MLDCIVTIGCMFVVMVLKKKRWNAYYCKTVKPLTMIESFSMGILVICSDLGNMGYTIIEGENGAKFDPLSTDSIVDATNRFSTYDYEKLRKNSLITFKENFSKEKNMELFGKIYESGKV